MSSHFSLDLDDPQTREVMKSGAHSEKPGLRCVPRMVQMNGEKSFVVFSALEEKDFRYPKWKAYLKSLRAVSLTATASPVLLVGLWAQVLQLEPRWSLGLLAVLGVVLLQIATNVLNDIEDYLKLIDLPGGHGGSGVLQEGWLTVQELKGFALISLSLGLLVSIPIFIEEPLMTLVCAAVGTLGTVAYSSQPLGFKYRALGDLTVFLCCGPILTIGAAVAFLGSVPVWAWLLGAFFGFLACAILHANNLQDIDVDRRSGSKTLAGLIGFENSRKLLVAFYALALISLIASFGIALPNALIFTPILVLALIPTVQLLKTAYRATGTASPLLNFIRIRAAQLHLIYGLAAAAILIGAWLFNPLP